MPFKYHDAATSIQQWYRRHVAMYTSFGSMMFARKSGAVADFGRLSFLSGTRTACFITVSDTTSTAMLSHFLEKYWALPRPDVLISVTGSAATLQLTAQLQRVFDRGLAAAAAMTNAWLFTGGTDSGVMKLVGEAMHKYGLDVPVVGVAPWGAVSGRAALEGCRGGTVRYKPGPPKPNAGRLNPYHTHLILVDHTREYAPNEMAWGHEIPLRSRLERVYATSKGVPVVLLVVQGGPNTLDMMIASAELGSPLLVLSDSGGAATAVAQFCEGGIDAVSDPAFSSSSAKLAQLHELNEARAGTLLCFYRLQDEIDNSENMSTALLRALFLSLMHTQATALKPSANPSAASKLQLAVSEATRRRQDTMKRALLLTVKWDQPEFASRMLAELPQTDDYLRPMRTMLQHALELQRVEIVRILLEHPGTQLEHVNLAALYLHVEDPFNYLRSSESLQRQLRKHLADIARAGPDSFRLYKKVVGPFLREVSPHLLSVVRSSKSADHVDLFWWATFMGDLPLARQLWAHVDNPLHCVLLASHVLKTMARSVTWGRAEVEAKSFELEGWATSVLDLVHEQEVAHFILSQPVPRWKLGAMVDLALQMELKAFLSHRHTQSLLVIWWRGGYPGSACHLSKEDSLLEIAVWALVPFLNPYFSACCGSSRRAPVGAHERPRQPGSAEPKEVLLGALAQAFKLSGAERERAQASEAPAPQQGGAPEQPRGQRGRTPIGGGKVWPLRKRDGLTVSVDDFDGGGHSTDSLTSLSPESPSPRSSLPRRAGPNAQTSKLVRQHTVAHIK